MTNLDIQFQIDNTVLINAGVSSWELIEENNVKYLMATCGEHTIKLEMSPSVLINMALALLPYVPNLDPQYVDVLEDDPVRVQAQFIKHYDNRSIQILLRECQSDSLIDFLWYMNDGDLIKLFFRNMSQRAAEMLFEDLQVKWGTKNPRKCYKTDIQHGRLAVQDILTNTYKLIQEGSLDDIMKGLDNA